MLTIMVYNTQIKVEISTIINLRLNQTSQIQFDFKAIVPALNQYLGNKYHL